MLATNALKASLLTLVLGMLFFMHGVMAQSQRRISGRITDDKGNGLSGVSISIKGTQRGTVSDTTGNYVITVADNNTVAGRQQNRRVNLVVSGDAIGVQESSPDAAPSVATPANTGVSNPPQ